MDHADTTDSERDVRKSEIVDDTISRRNSTRPTSEFIAEDGPIVASDDELAYGHEDGTSSMEVDDTDVQEGDMTSASDGELMTALDELGATSATHIPAGSGDDGANGRRTEEQYTPLSSSGTGQRKMMNLDRSLGEFAISSDTVRASHAAHDHDDGSPHQLLDDDNDQPHILSNEASNTSFLVEQCSFEHGREMFMDDEDDDDVLSGKTPSCEDFVSDSDAAVFRTPSGRTSADRAPLEEAYGLFIHPTDTCLADARERLHVALEQTRLLGQTFTEQAYDRYRCVLKPVPEALEDIIEPILIDPEETLDTLREEADAIKAEKDAEIKQARQAGVGLEELAYFGEGLHLVILPEDEIDENEIDITAFPERGPINPETGEVVEEISAAAAAATEQVFDRIRRIRAIRMGGDIKELGISQTAGSQLKRNLGAKDHQAMEESFSPGFFASSAFALISPALSVDSNGAAHQHSTKGALQHLLTLAPGAEGVRPDGTFTASQSALIAAGVGLHEMKRDSRIDPLRQRMVHPNYFSSTLSPNFLSPLLGSHQIHRLQAAEIRIEKSEVRSGARESIKSVLEIICSSFVGSGAEIADKYDDKGGLTIHDSDAGSGIIKDIRRGALEIGLLRQIHSAMHESTHAIAGLTDPSESDDFDPLLAFSVMNAVGLVRKRDDDDGKLQHRIPVSNADNNAYAQALGLASLTSLPPVRKFFATSATSSNEEMCTIANDDELNVTKSAKSPTRSATNNTDNGKNSDDIHEIRGGGDTGENLNGHSTSSTSKADVPISDSSLAPSEHFLAGYAGQIYGGTSQLSPWQRQLGVSHDLYHSTPISHQQLNSSHLSPLHSDLSDLYLRNGQPIGIPQHPQYTTSLGLIQSQVELNFLEQELARTILLRDQHHAAAAQAQQNVTDAASARFQASLSSVNRQNPFVASLQDCSNESQLNSSLLASYARSDTQQLQRKRSWSLTESASPSIHKRKKAALTPEPVTDMKRSASAPPPPHTPNGTKKHITPLSDPTTPPIALHQDIADLIAQAKFHEAHSLSQSKSDESGVLLVNFLLSLGATIPISQSLIANMLEKKLCSSNYQLQLHELAGSGTSATAWREVIVATISIWLWIEHRDSFDDTAVESGNDEASPNCLWLINLAIGISLSALATFFDSQSSEKCKGRTIETPNDQVAAITSKSLVSQVFVDHRTDASFPIIEDLVKLLDTLRTDALRVKTQERVLLAALASRCGSMTEAFSNAYVSSIVRSGVALGHENVCEMGQDEACRASTLLPYDYFHDNVGIWEEPCRPITGYHSSVGGSELKRQAHARSLIQKSMLRLQHRLGLKGGISDGGPYFPAKSTSRPAASSTPAAFPQLVKTPSGSLKRNSFLGLSGPGEDDFNPEHSVEPMIWDPDDLGNSPYGDHEFVGKCVVEDASFAAQQSSTQELEWEDVANMFFHGGSTRNIDIDYDFGSQDQQGKKEIYAPFVQPFDVTSINCETGQEPYSDEDICDETILQRHQDGLIEMKLKLDESLEKRKLLAQQRGRMKR